LDVRDHTADLLLIDTLDEGRKDISLGIRSTRSEQDVVWVPVNRQHSRPDGLLDVFRYPPVILLVEGADGNGPAPVSL
jgi:hypothetical protein